MKDNDDRDMLVAIIDIVMTTAAALVAGVALAGAVVLVNWYRKNPDPREGS